MRAHKTLGTAFFWVWLLVTGANAAPPVAVHEIAPPGGVSGPGWVELYRDADARLDLGGWTVTTPWWTCRIEPGAELLPFGLGFVGPERGGLAASCAPGAPALGGVQLIAPTRDGGFLADEIDLDGVGSRLRAAVGFTYERVDPEIPGRSIGAWRVSLAPGGTPGRPNSVRTDAPFVIREDPPRGWTAAGSSRVEVVFSREVEGVHAHDLEVDGRPARAVEGRGSGPYVFEVEPLSPRGASVRLSPGAIRDARDRLFGGDAWLYPEFTAIVSVPDDARGAPGSTVDVPISVAPLDGLLAVDINLQHDPSVATATLVSKTALAGSLTLTYNLSPPGTVRISLFGTAPLSGAGGPLLIVRYQVAGAVGASTPLDLVVADINEGGIPTTLDDGTLTVCDGTDADNDGVSLCAGDCDDTDGSRFPGNPESCNGLDEDCDGIPDDGFPNTDADPLADCVDPDDDGDGALDGEDCAPLDPTAAIPAVEVQGVLMDGGSPTMISWQAQGADVTYDVVSGAVAELRTIGFGGATCAAQELGAAQVPDPRPDPAGGAAFYYLVRAQNGCGAATWGFRTGGVERAVPSVCP